MDCQNTKNAFLNLVDNESGIKLITPRCQMLDFGKETYNPFSVYDKTIERWLLAIDMFDQDMTAHTLRVTAISLELARLLGLNNHQMACIQYGTLLHDIGKMGIPGSIIQKPGKLTETEYQIVQRHPRYAYEWISKQNYDQETKDIPLYHHERWDGKGYPSQLKGEDIPFLARVVAVVDVWDAVTSDRPYRCAMSQNQAIEIIKSESGKQFDPDIVIAFIGLGLHANRIINYAEALIL